mmetsp:Transcript_89541/g.252309  ORF Transcript_89541/g.252309 Transcript_89541/m.252309 type:complete len:221 (+) Transcript_89541:71-733(+)
MPVVLRSCLCFLFCMLNCVSLRTVGEEDDKAGNATAWHRRILDELKVTFSDMVEPSVVEGHSIAEKRSIIENQSVLDEAAVADAQGVRVQTSTRCLRILPIFVFLMLFAYMSVCRQRHTKNVKTDGLSNDMLTTGGAAASLLTKKTSSWFGPEFSSKAKLNESSAHGQNDISTGGPTSGGMSDCSRWYQRRHDESRDASASLSPSCGQHAGDADQSTAAI